MLSGRHRLRSTRRYTPARKRGGRQTSGDVCVLDEVPSSRAPEAAGAAEGDEGRRRQLHLLGTGQPFATTAHPFGGQKGKAANAAQPRGTLWVLCLHSLQ